MVVVHNGYRVPYQLHCWPVITDDELELLDLLDATDDLLEVLLENTMLELEELLLIDELDATILLEATEDLLLDATDDLLLDAEDEVTVRGGSIPEIRPSLP